MLSTETLLAPSQLEVPEEAVRAAFGPYEGVTSIAGGTGGYNMSAALSPLLGERFTALICPTDDGGGTGLARKNNPGFIAVGDLRQSIGAASTASPEAVAEFNRKYGPDETDPRNIPGQTVGNLEILEAWKQTSGDIVKALEIVSGRWGVRGTILPTSADDRYLRLTMPNGYTIDGEHEIESTDIASYEGSKLSFYKLNPDGSHEAAEAMLLPQARAKLDLSRHVFIGPGDLYTSLMPNLAVTGVPEALRADGKIIAHVLNIMNGPVATKGMDARTYLDVLNEAIGTKVKTVFYNTRKPSDYALREQARGGSHPVEVDEKALIRAGYDVIGADMLYTGEIKISKNDILAHQRSSIRHDWRKVYNVFADYLGIKI
jgi:uncharacterized cofD-like protein